ncbi:hypothetical protein BJ973_000976 [Actinoplanes tereljensis]|uniref:SaeA second Fn3-like domain-containing protein n=1 Tax=Paractinoplanes tereljensis TaxID=571912 RepID=A0A919P090_9ACTN|nr:hypothetical protein [Actinoplanes tereljensis]GIF26532.1 hypothetical protein Ate02nite_92620 [Actinoplanes tereljensis]
MPSDWDDYKATVLDPARKAGNVPPEDLFLRYRITGVHREPVQFDARVEETVRFWKTQKTVSKVYQPLAGALLVAHAELNRAKALTYAEFARRRETAAAQATTRLDDRIALVAKGIPLLTRAALEHLVAENGGVLSADEVRARIKLGGVTIIEPPWDIPDRPAESAIALPPKLRLLGLRISPEVVFSRERLAAGFTLKQGFQLTADGGRLTSEVLEVAKGLQAQRTRDDRTTAADTVLTILLRAQRAGTLDQLVCWEVAELVRAQLGHGLPPAVAAEAAVAAGLDRAEALELTASLVPGTGRPAEAKDGETVSAALAAGSLREAERLLAALPEAAVPAEVRVRVRAAAAALQELVGRADRAEREGRSEETAGLLAEAVHRAVDDPDLAARLDRIPPPPPAGVRAESDGVRIAVRWAPSPAVTGRIGYRVVRAAAAAISPDGGEPVAEATVNHAADPSPPVARPVVYTVFAVRGTSVSPGVAAAPVTLLPPVTGFELGTDGSSVTGSWQSHPAASAVEVTRTRTDGDGGEVVVAAGSGPATAFADPAVELDVNYAYVVRPVYSGPGGERCTGPAVAGTVLVERPPEAVTDLRAEVVDGPDGSRLRLTWTTPPGGRVEIRRSAGPAPWPAGERVTAAAVNGWGEVAGGGHLPGAGGRTEVLVPTGQGNVVLTAVSRGRSGAVIGNSLELALAATVTGLRARRRWDSVQVDWLWPDGIHEARVTWSAPDRRGEREISRRTFVDDGGVRLDTGPGEVAVSVRSVIRERHTELASTPVTVRVAGRPPRVEWALQSARLRRRRVLRLRADQDCVLPDLRLVLGSAGSARVAGRPLVAGQVAEVDVTAFVPATGTAAAACEPADPAATTVVLVPWTGHGQERR